MADQPEFLTINSVELAIDGAWRVVDPQPLLGERSRGTDFVIPGAAGVLPRARTRDALRAQLGMYVFGDNNQAGTPYANGRAGLRDNVEYLRANLLAHTVGEVTCTYTFPDASTVSGSCLVVAIDVGEYQLAQNVARAAIDIILTDGRLA